MEVYLVGGAVRDGLLGRPVHERDWVVVGSTPEALLAQGYRPVGRDFPVFLHPETQEEYALARTERQVGAGHRGFVCHAAPTVTLTEDLLRRDLTINALAQTESGAIIDPYGGQADLAARCLRHVSPAFSEDPLRVFRVARFSAQLAPWGFTVAPETMALMRAMAERGDLAHLSAERVAQETQKAWASPDPQRYLAVLAEASALSPWLVELAPLATTALSARASWTLLPDGPSRWIHTLADLSAPERTALSTRLRTPTASVELANLLASHESLLQHADAAETYLAVLQGCDAWRRPARFQSLLALALADETARQTWTTALTVTQTVDAQQLLNDIAPADRPARLAAARCAALRTWLGAST